MKHFPKFAPKGRFLVLALEDGTIFDYGRYATLKEAKYIADNWDGEDPEVASWGTAVIDLDTNELVHKRTS